MERPILIGYMGLEMQADDWSDWEGHITGPINPKGANRFWEDPIPMIEKRAYDALEEELKELRWFRDEVNKRVLPGETDTHDVARAWVTFSMSQFRIMREALEKIAWHATAIERGEIARKALKATEGMK